MDRVFVLRIAENVIARRRAEIDEAIYNFLIGDWTEAEMVARIRWIKSNETDMLILEDAKSLGTKREEKLNERGNGESSL